MYTTNSFHSIVLLYLSLLLDGKLSELGLAIKETRSISQQKNLCCLQVGKGHKM